MDIVAWKLRRYAFHAALFFRCRRALRGFSLDPGCKIKCAYRAKMCTKMIENGTMIPHRMENHKKNTRARFLAASTIDRAKSGYERMKVDPDLLCKVTRKFKSCMEDKEDNFPEKKKRVPLWVFIAELLALDKNEVCIRWTYRIPYEFFVTNPSKLAAIWGYVRKNPSMTYTKLCRALRYYYRKSIIEKVSERSFTYRFVNSRFTRPFLSRCFPSFSAKNPLMSEPVYKRIHDYMIGESEQVPFPDFSSSLCDMFDDEPNQSSERDTYSSVSSMDDISDVTTVISSPQSTEAVAHDTWDDTETRTEFSHYLYSSCCSPTPSKEPTLKEMFSSYREGLKARTQKESVPVCCEPPSPSLFWLVNPDNSD